MRDVPSGSTLYGKAQRRAFISHHKPEDSIRFVPCHFHLVIKPQPAQQIIFAPSGPLFAPHRMFRDRFQESEAANTWVSQSPASVVHPSASEVLPVSKVPKKDTTYDYIVFSYHIPQAVGILYPAINWSSISVQEQLAPGTHRSRNSGEQVWCGPIGSFTDTARRL